ncbi:hypothetical protein TNCT6_01150 [Streptomyces sp. 6-11-2]|nr:hypothetical protein TNCT6_01150 [Streptomyces sp. 6-11-2]
MPIFIRCPGHLGHDMKFGQIGDLRHLAGNHPFRIVIRLPPKRRGLQDPAMSTTDVFPPLPSAADLSARSQQQPGRPQRPGPPRS